MTRVIPIDVVVEAEVAIFVAEIPVARGMNAVDEAAIVQYRKVEAAAIPAHDLRCVSLDDAKKILDQARFRIGWLAEASDAEPAVVAKRTTDRHDPMQMVLQKIRADAVAPLCEGQFSHLAVLERRPLGSQSAQAGNVRNRLDVEAEDRRHCPWVSAAEDTSSDRPA